jgi:hypothetical protein
MEPKEKAIQLVNKYLRVYDGRVEQAKRAALICVDEVLIADMFMMTEEQDLFWSLVRSEIKKLN